MQVDLTQSEIAHLCVCVGLLRQQNAEQLKYFTAHDDGTLSGEIALADSLLLKLKAALAQADLD